jgi:hypothetical protein
MDTDTFLVWLGNQLRNLGQVPVENDRRFDATLELVKTAMESLDNMSTVERNQVFHALNDVPKTNMLRDYRIPYDIRDHYDWIEGILATLEAHLEG